MLLTPTDKRIYVSPTSANTMATTRDYTSWKFSFVDNIHIPSRLSIYLQNAWTERSGTFAVLRHVHLDVRQECIWPWQGVRPPSGSGDGGRATTGSTTSTQFLLRRSITDRGCCCHYVIPARRRRQASERRRRNLALGSRGTVRKRMGGMSGGDAIAG